MSWLSAGVLLRIPGLTDLQYGRIADQLYAARDPNVIKADLVASGDEVWFSARVEADSIERARAKLAEFAAAVIRAAGVPRTCALTGSSARPAPAEVIRCGSPICSGSVPRVRRHGWRDPTALRYCAERGTLDQATDRTDVRAGR